MKTQSRHEVYTLMQEDTEQAQSRYMNAWKHKAYIINTDDAWRHKAYMMQTHHTFFVDSL